MLSGACAALPLSLHRQPKTIASIEAQTTPLRPGDLPPGASGAPGGPAAHGCALGAPRQWPRAPCSSCSASAAPPCTLGPRSAGVKVILIVRDTLRYLFILRVASLNFGGMNVNKNSKKSDRRPQVYTPLKRTVDIKIKRKAVHTKRKYHG